MSNAPKASKSGEHKLTIAMRAKQASISEHMPCELEDARCAVREAIAKISTIPAPASGAVVAVAVAVAVSVPTDASES